jgi:hypothetical protein
VTGFNDLSSVLEDGRVGGCGIARRSLLQTSHCLQVPFPPRKLICKAVLDFYISSSKFLEEGQINGRKYIRNVLFKL